MPIELPVVFWLCDKADSSYADSLAETVRNFRPHAKAKLSRYVPPNSSFRDPQSLVYLALWSLQQKILGQYLPKLEPGRTKGVGCVWPWWETGGMKVEYGDKRLHMLRKLPKASGEEGRDRLPDDLEYKYRFYRNDSVEQRQTWFRHFLEEEARKEVRGLDPDDKTEEYVDLPDNRRLDASERGVLKEQLLNLRAITDLKDWQVINRKAPHDVPAERKRQERSQKRFRAADEILKLRSPAAKSYYKRLVQANDSERSEILDEYIRRYAKQSKKPGDE